MSPHKFQLGLVDRASLDQVYCVAFMNTFGWIFLHTEIAAIAILDGFQSFAGVKNIYFHGERDVTSSVTSLQ